MSADEPAVMRISAGFFQRLLHSTAAGDALESLVASWTPRVRPGQAFLGLSPTEHTAHVTRAYVAAVANGGHPAFFHAYPVETGMLVRVVDALLLVGLPTLARALGEAACLCPGQAVASFDNASELDRAMGDRVAGGWHHRPTEALDAVVWSALDVDERLLAFLRAHVDDVLRPERGLPSS